MNRTLAPEIRMAVDRLDLKASLVLQGFLLDHCLKLLMEGETEDKPKSSLIIPRR